MFVEYLKNLSEQIPEATSFYTTLRLALAKTENKVTTVEFILCTFYSLKCQMLKCQLFNDEGMALKHLKGIGTE